MEKADTLRKFSESVVVKFLSNVSSMKLNQGLHISTEAEKQNFVFTKIEDIVLLCCTTTYNTSYK